MRRHISRSTNRCWDGVRAASSTIPARMRLCGITRVLLSAKAKGRNRRRPELYENDRNESEDFLNG